MPHARRSNSRITARKWATASRVATDPTIYYKKLAERAGIQHLLSQQPLGVGVFVIKLFWPLTSNPSMAPP